MLENPVASLPVCRTWDMLPVYVLLAGVIALFAFDIDLVGQPAD